MAEPIVLSYHDIRPDSDDPSVESSSSIYTITPSSFQDQMEVLHRWGYTSMTAAEFDSYLQGDFVPSQKSFYLTFDDGTSGLYEYADPILEKLGFTATSFLIGAYIGEYQPYYLNWPKIRKMQGSGRWSFQSHSFDFHHRVDGGSGEVPAYAHRGVSNGIVESDTEFSERVSSDNDSLDRLFQDNGLEPATQFSFPFSTPSAADTKDDSFHKVAVDTQVDSFNAVFTNRRNPLPVLSDLDSNPDVLERLEITSEHSTSDFIDMLYQTQSIPVGSYDALTLDDSWFQGSRYAVAPVDFDRLRRGDGFQFEADTLLYSKAFWAAQRASGWDDYSVSATANALTPSIFAGLSVKENSEAHGLLVYASYSRYSIFNGGTLVDYGDLVASPTHTLRIVTSGEHSSVIIDGTTVGSFRTGVGKGTFSLVSKRDDVAYDFPVFSSVKTGSATSFDGDY
ncbi:polysaccharide deacetylase family protein [Corynebacterium sputi]|uniref:polysaccharide deacetylase family protein n=1 Tax=Corynebacterium sputi TaxID=489915 RepID=UPI001969C248|nr:polysaccharide deacetylase family protein [Corynebacterium sputi]